MKKQSVNLTVSVLAAGMAMICFVTGCAGPSTRILPRDNSQSYWNSPEEIPVLEEANPFYLQETLEILTASERSAGSRGETETARRLQQMLSDYGYEVTRQRFRVWDGAGTNEATGTNVVAVRRSYAEDADILVIGTHHDTAPGSPGANDNAAGVAAWLETARLVSRLPSDTELRFVSFSGTEDGWLGSRYYVDSLSRKERERVIGVIQIDALGYAEFPQMVLGTRDGEATMLGNQLKKACWDVLGETLQYEIREDSDAMSFVNGQIPAVCLTQKRSGYEAGTPVDQADTVDIERVARLTDALTQTAAYVISTDTPSMLAKSRYMNRLRDSAYVQHRETLTGFGETREALEKKLHVQGTEVSSHESQDGKRIEGYQYQMKWFDVDQILLTNYYFVDGKLDSVTLDADSAGVDFADMKERLESWYGSPDQEEAVPDGIAYGWTDRMRRLHASLIPNADGFDVELTGIQPETLVYARLAPDGSLLQQYHDTWDSALGSAFSHAELLMKKIRSFLPEQPETRIDSIVLYTDGLGADQGHLELVEEEEDAPIRTELWVDLEDALLPDGSWRDETATEKLLAYLYGEILEQTRAEVYADFSDRFGSSDAETETEVQAGMRPGEKKLNDQELPDFAESFRYFVLAAEPDMEPNAWKERIGFFYEQPDACAYRNLVRERLGLQSLKLSGAD